MAAAASIGADSTGYIWEDPGDSIMIQISLDVVERLGAAVEQGLGAGARGTEVGGILLGRTLPGFGRAVLVEDFELTPCEHLRGASYTLSPKDRRILGSRLERRSPQSVVGYFRSHTRHYEPICEQVVVQKKKTKLTHIAFNATYPILVVGDDRYTLFIFINIYKRSFSIIKNPT